MRRRAGLAFFMGPLLALVACRKGNEEAHLPNPPQPPSIRADGAAKDTGGAARSVSSNAIAPSVSEERRPPGQHMVLLYSSNVLGEYDAHPLGGLARRKTVVEATQKETRALVQVDAGDLLVPPTDTTASEKKPALPPDRGELERRMRLLLKGMAELGLQALSPGETDLTLGAAWLRDNARRAKLPLVSANIVDRAGKPWYAADLLLKVGGVSVGIFGILGSPSAAETSGAELPGDVSLADPIAAAKTAVASLRSRGARLVVGLCHLRGGVAEARALTAAVSGIDVIVLGHSGETLEKPLTVGATQIVEAYRRGTYLGRLALDVGDHDVRAHHEIVRLEPKIVPEPRMKALVQAYVDESKRRADKKLWAALAPPPRPTVIESWDYGSNGACELCHQEAQKQWKTTAHAAAMQTLASKARDRDVYCLGCHATGFRRPGGPQDLDTAVTYFRDVGCESCHGPSSLHVRTKKTTATRLKVPESVCLECHRPDQSPDPFDYQEAMKLVLGPGHGLKAK